MGVLVSGPFNCWHHQGKASDGEMNPYSSAAAARKPRSIHLFHVISFHFLITFFGHLVNDHWSFVWVDQLKYYVSFHIQWYLRQILRQWLLGNAEQSKQSKTWRTSLLLLLTLCSWRTHHRWSFKGYILVHLVNECCLSAAEEWCHWHVWLCLVFSHLFCAF